MKKIMTAFLLMLSLTSYVYAQEADSLSSETQAKSIEEITLPIGESKVIKLDFEINKLGVGSPDIIEAIRVSSNQILINAINNGKTNLLIWSGDELKKEYEVIVGEITTVDDVVEELGQLLKGVEGIEIRSAGKRIVIEGEVFSQQEIDNINTVIADIPNVVNLATTSKVYKKVLAEEIQNTIGIDTIKVRYSPNGYVLEGTVDTEDQKIYANSIAESYVNKVINALYIKKDEKQLTRLVEMEVKVIDINRDALLNFANDLSVGGNINASSDTDENNILSGNLSLNDAQLRKLEEQGNGRVLLENTLVAESGKEASLFIGDEIPITVSQNGGDLSTEYRKIGVNFKFTPVLYDLDTVNLDVSVGSSTQSGESSTGAPIINNVEVNTATYVKNETPIILAGLIRQRQLDSYFGNANRDYVGIGHDPDQPAQSRNSFLSGSNDPNRFTRERREVLVVVKPSIVGQASSAGGKLKKVIERSFKNQEAARYTKPAKPKKVKKKKSSKSKRIILSHDK